MKTLILYDIDGTITNVADFAERNFKSSYETLSSNNRDLRLNPRNLESAWQAYKKHEGGSDSEVYSSIFRSLGFGGIELMAITEDFIQIVRSNTPKVLTQMGDKYNAKKGIEAILRSGRERESLSQGVETANSVEAAQYKLQHVGLDGYFQKRNGFILGGYSTDRNPKGEQAQSRRDIIEAGISKFSENGLINNGTKIWIIDDSEHAISAVKEKNGKDMYVAWFADGKTPSEIEQVRRKMQPDLVLKEWSNPEDFFNLLNSIK